jgi:hypothetical protein
MARKTFEGARAGTVEVRLLARRWVIASGLFALFALVSATASDADAAPGDAVIALDVSADPGVQSAATYPLFVAGLDIDAVINAPNATGAYEIEVLYDPLKVRFEGWELGAFLGSTGRVPSCYEIVLERSVRIGCATSGPPPPPGASGTGLLATLRFRPMTAGQSCFVLLLAKTADVAGASLPTVGQSACVIFSPDSDGDGCSDSQELGDSPLAGGLRDPGNAWDFFDVTSDRTVDLLDALSVLQWFGSAPGAPAANAHDRYVPDPSQPWRTAEADDGVDLEDALAVLASFGANCTAG